MGDDLRHDVLTAREMRWDGLSNGNLLAAAEGAGFDVMVTGDQNLTYQQNDLKRSIGLVVLTEIDRRLLVGHANLVLAVIDRLGPGGYELVVIPNPKRPQR
jgi:hypothetical protein